MLRINKQKNPSVVRSYFTSKAEYYRGGAQELPGIWGGTGAALLGLEGEVAKPDFAALSENLNPATRAKLTLRDRKGRIVGHDFNFHCPKSLSVLFALCGDAAVLTAFRAALALTLAEMEQAMQTRVRKGGQMADRATGNAVWSQHIHLTARPVDGIPDPHVHAHVFFFNATFDGVESQWKASKLSDIYREAPYYQAVFHGHLAKLLAEQGYPIERTATGWEIAGLSALLPKFSRRTEEIERVAVERGITDPGAKGELGAATRKHKQKDASMGELRQRWLGRLDEADCHALAASAASARGKPGAGDCRVSAHLAVDKAIKRCFASGHSLVPETRLLSAALREGAGFLDTARIRRILPAFNLEPREYGGKRFFARMPPQTPWHAPVPAANQACGPAGNGRRYGSLSQAEWDAVTSRAAIRLVKPSDLPPGVAERQRSNWHLINRQRQMQLEAEAPDYSPPPPPAPLPRSHGR